MLRGSFVEDSTRFLASIILGPSSLGDDGNWYFARGVFADPSQRRFGRGRRRLAKEPGALEARYFLSAYANFVS